MHHCFFSSSYVDSKLQSYRKEEGRNNKTLQNVDVAIEIKLLIQELLKGCLFI